MGELRVGAGGFSVLSCQPVRMNVWKI